MKFNLRFSKTSLKNGLQLILCPMAEARSVGVNIFVATGSRFESPANNGVSHFLEHLLFKGSRNYPSQVLISEGIEGAGGIINGYTTSQVTNYWIKVLPQFLGESLRLLSDMFLNPLLKEADIESEKGVIREEIRMSEDNPVDSVGELSQKALWGSSPLGYPTLGTEASLRSLDRSEIQSYYTSRYKGRNVTISIAGKFRPAEVERLIEQRFLSLRSRGRVFPAAPAKTRKSVRLVQKKETAQVHLVFALATLPFLSRERPVLEVIASLLGQGMSSRLFLNVRDKGLAYAVHCDNDFHSDCGSFMTYAGVEKERLQLSVKTVFAEFEKLAAEEISRAEVDRAKEKIKGPFFFQLEDPVKVAEYLGYQCSAFGAIESPGDYISSLESVDAPAVRELAAALFQKEKFTLAAVGPFSEPEFRSRLDF